MDNFCWLAGLYLRLIAGRVRAQLQYRVSFALDFLGSCFATLLDFLAVIVLFAHLPRLGGWNLVQVAYFYGVANIAFALCDLFIGHLDLFPAMVRTGTFDLVLVRPTGALFQILTQDLALRRLGRVLQGAVVLGWAMGHASVPWTGGRVAMVPIMVASGVGIYAAVWIIGSSVAFWTPEVKEITNSFTYGGSFLASYPVNIFGGWTRRMLAFVVPMAFVSYYPGLYVLNHPDPLGGPRLLQFIAPVVAILLIVVAFRVWRLGVSRYQSTGS